MTHRHPRSILFPYTTLFRSCVLRFASEAHPQLFDAGRYPALAAHAAHCEALPPFRDIVQPLAPPKRSEEHTSELQSHVNLVCRLLLEKKKKKLHVKSAGVES